MLTIVIPSYNHEKYIVECLAAALAVNIPGLKVLIVDDGSTDETVANLTKYLSTNPKREIATLVTKKNGGVVSSLNYALSVVDTEYVYFIASDDIVIPEGLTAIFEVLKASPAKGFVIGGGVYKFEDKQSTPVYKRQHAEFFALPSAKRSTEIFVNYPSPLLIQSTVFRLSALQSIGGWDPLLKWDDYPVFVKLLSTYPDVKFDFDYVPAQTVVHYRQHDVNTYKDIDRQFSFVREALKKLAPPAIKYEAVGKASAFYMLTAIKQRNFQSLNRLIKSMTAVELVRGIYHMPAVAISHIKRKYNE